MWRELLSAGAYNNAAEYAQMNAFAKAEHDEEMAREEYERELYERELLEQKEHSREVTDDEYQQTNE